MITRLPGSDTNALPPSPEDRTRPIGDSPTHSGDRKQPHDQARLQLTTAFDPKYHRKAVATCAHAVSARPFELTCENKMPGHVGMCTLAVALCVWFTLATTFRYFLSRFIMWDIPVALARKDLVSVYPRTSGLSVDRQHPF